MSESDMQAELERLRAQNAQLKSEDKGGLTLKVSEKGGLSVRHGPVPGHPLQGTMAPHPGECDGGSRRSSAKTTPS
jgi:hypothetical protein